MVDESMGDAFIDAAMPSFFSSMYVLANAIYKISLPAILCLSIVVVGIFLYYTLVYRRARKSRIERKILLQTRKHNGDFGRKEKRPRGVAYGVGEFIQRLFVSFNDGIVILIQHLSDKRLKKRVAVENSFGHKWCAMNKPALHQGVIYSNRGRDSISVTRFEDSATDGHCPVRKRKIVPTDRKSTRLNSSHG